MKVNVIISIKKMAAQISRKKCKQRWKGEGRERERTREREMVGERKTDEPFLTVVTIPTKTAFVRWTSSVMQTSPRYVSTQDN